MWNVGVGHFSLGIPAKEYLFCGVGFCFKTIIDKNLTSLLYKIRRRDEKRFAFRSYGSNFSRGIVLCFPTRG